MPEPLFIVSRACLKCLESVVLAGLLILMTVSVQGQEKHLTDSLEEIVNSTKPDSLKVQALAKLAWLYRINAPEKSEDFAARAIEKANKINYQKGIAEANIVLGYVNLIKGDYVKAAQNYVNSLKIYERINDSDGIAKAYNNLGLVYDMQRNYKQALECYKKTLEIKRAQHEPPLASTLNNIGVIYGKTGDNDKAKEFIWQSLRIEAETGNGKGLAESYQSLGNVAMNEKDIRNATKLYNRALFIYDSIKEPLAKARCLENIATMLNETGHYEESISYAQQALILIDKVNIAYDREYIYEVLSRANEKSGNYKEALQYKSLLMEAKDKVYKNELARQTEEIQAKYETGKKEQEIALLKKDGKLFELYAIIAIIGSLLLLAILFLFILRSKSRKKQQALEFEKNKAVFEQQALRAQMNPHFIFNALNSIQHYILNNETQYAYDFLAKFSRLIRQVLVNSQRNEISLRDELDLLKLYIELEHRRFTNRFDYKIIYADDLPLDDIKIPVMLVQPFVENAIWHGIMNLDKSEVGKVEVSFKIANDFLHITVEDNGVGREEARKRKGNSEHESVGMIFTAKRLELYKKISKEEAKIEITDLKENGNAAGTKVDIYIPVNL